MGYGKRVKNSFVGMLFAFVLFPGSLFLLAWNERDAVRQTGAITEIERVAVADVPADAVDSQLDGQLVHMASEAVTDDVLEYAEFGIREPAVRLRWNASIYQWTEHRRTEDDRTIYTYSKEWVDAPINSSSFHQSGHSNEGSTMSFSDGRQQASDVRFGAFHLSENLIGQIDAEQPYPLDPSVALDVRPQGFVNGGVFQTGSEGDPQIGDQRVEVFVVGPRHDATVMARQSGETFAKYETKVGIPKEILYVGKLTKSEVIQRQRTEAAFRRWMFRGLGFVLMWVSLAMLLSPIKALLSFIPFAGRLLEGAIGIVTFLMALIISAVVIAIAWFVVRPVLSISLLVVAVVGFIYLYRQKSTSDVIPDPSRSGPPPLPNA